MKVKSAVLSAVVMVGIKQEQLDSSSVLGVNAKVYAACSARCAEGEGLTHSPPFLIPSLRVARVVQPCLL